ncbi:MAG TPA: FHA domain-containing protein [Solirubrobacteraceae bacterium]|nr:FHA domain-containing protein [Solirubrobacteraceae bacterium]
MTLQALLQPTAEGITERFDPIDCLDERSRLSAGTNDPLAPGRYIEVQGPDRTATIPIESDVLHIGRGIAADLQLDENSVSRRHAVIAVRDDGVRILDDRSSNGTFVNGTRVQQAELSNGDVIVIGRVLLRYVEIW